MRDIKFTLQRDVLARDYTLGRLIVDGKLYGYTCEDTDRHLENGGQKVHGQTAIPRGLYHLTATMSQRFGRMMPLIQGIFGFDGVRIHGGNTAADTEGCPLLGAIRTATGVQKCADVNAALLKMITDAESQGDVCWIEVR